MPQESSTSWRSRLGVTAALTYVNASIAALMFSTVDFATGHAFSEKMPKPVAYTFMNAMPFLLGALHMCCVKFKTTKEELNARIAGGLVGTAVILAVGNASIMLLSDDPQMKEKATQFFTEFNEGGVVMLATGLGAGAYKAAGGSLSSFFTSPSEEEDAYATAERGGQLSDMSESEADDGEEAGLLSNQANRGDTSNSYGTGGPGNTTA